MKTIIPPDATQYAHLCERILVEVERATARRQRSRRKRLLILALTAGLILLAYFIL